MKNNIIKYVNQLQSYKTAIKNLHWSSSNMNEHKLFDEIAETVDKAQDEIAEIAQGLHGKIQKNELKPTTYTISTDKKFLKDLIKDTEKFYGTIQTKEYIGMRSVVEAFLGDLNKYLYLLPLTIKEDLTHVNKVSLTENDLHQIIKESVMQILKEFCDTDAAKEDMYWWLADKEEEETRKILQGKMNPTRSIDGTMHPTKKGAQIHNIRQHYLK